MAEKISAAQRAQFFAMATRQNIQTLGVKKLEEGSQIVNFEFPKARYYSKSLVRVDAVLNVKHPTLTEIESDFFLQDRIIRRVSLDLNNGFKPYNIDGVGLKLLNMLRTNATIYDQNSDNPESLVYCPKKLKCSAAGVDNKIAFLCELTATLNDRDGIGYILLQNNSTLVNLKFEIATGAEIVKMENAETVVREVRIEPTLETFSIPADNRATPDLSVIKIVQSVKYSYMTSGQQVLNLQCGQIYRKVIFHFMKEDGTPLKTDDFTSNIELLFNTADCNYSLSPISLRNLNTMQYGRTLPEGVYVFDFSAMQGFPNYSGSRDFIDTEKLTVFSLRFHTKESGTVNVISETISRLV